MNKTQLDIVFDLTEKCPSCGKTELSEADKGNIFFENKCKSCSEKENGKNK